MPIAFVQAQAQVDDEAQAEAQDAGPLDVAEVVEEAHIDEQQLHGIVLDSLAPATDGTITGAETAAENNSTCSVCQLNLFRNTQAL